MAPLTHTARYGPDANLSLTVDRTASVSIKVPAGQRAVFTFSSQTHAESALLVYRRTGAGADDLELVIDAGTSASRTWNDQQLLQGGDFAITAWAKVKVFYRDMGGELHEKAGAWVQSKVRSENPPAGYELKFESDDADSGYIQREPNTGFDDSWDDVVALVKREPVAD